MQRHVLVLLVTFDLWVSTSCVCFPVFVLDLVVVRFCWLAGLRLGCQAALAPAELWGQGVGSVPTSLASSSAPAAAPGL